MLIGHPRNPHYVRVELCVADHNDNVAVIDYYQHVHCKHDKPEHTYIEKGYDVECKTSKLAEMAVKLCPFVHGVFVRIRIRPIYSKTGMKTLTHTAQLSVLYEGGMDEPYLLSVEIDAEGDRNPPMPDMEMVESDKAMEWVDGHIHELRKGLMDRLKLI